MKCGNIQTEGDAINHSHVINKIIDKSILCRIEIFHQSYLMNHLENMFNVNKFFFK